MCSIRVQIYNKHIKQENDTNVKHSKERKTTAELSAQNMTIARVLAMTLCLPACLCLSVTSRSSIETDERIELVLGLGASFYPSYTVLKGNFGISKNILSLFCPLSLITDKPSLTSLSRITVSSGDRKVQLRASSVTNNNIRAKAMSGHRHRSPTVVGLVTRNPRQRRSDVA